MLPSRPTSVFPGHQDISHSGQSNINIWYLDDATIGGPADQAVAEISIQREAGSIGLSLTCMKCEAISGNNNFLATIETVLPGCRCRQFDPSDCELDGAAIGSSAVTASLSKRADQLRQTDTRLASVDRHDALAILRISLGHSNAIYELRAGASFRDPQAVADYDEALRETMERGLNVQLDELAWQQCTLDLASSICHNSPGDRLLADSQGPAHTARAWQRPWTPSSGSALMALSAHPATSRGAVGFGVDS